VRAPRHRHLPRDGRTAARPADDPPAVRRGRLRRPGHDHRTAAAVRRARAAGAAVGASHRLRAGDGERRPRSAPGQRRAARAPRDTGIFLVRGAPRPGRPMTPQLYGVVDSADPDTIIERLQPFAGLAPLVQQSVRLTGYAQVMANADLGPHHGSGEPHSRSALVDAITPEIARAAQEMLDAGAAAFFQVRPVGGAVADLPDGATAYAHRSAGFSIVALGADPDRLDRAWSALAAHARGLYLSFDSSQRPERIAQAFPPATLARLRAIKAQVDPGGLFSDNFPVLPAAAD